MAAELDTHSESVQYEPVHVKLRQDRFDELCRIRSLSTQEEQANYIGITQAMISRLRSGKARPGARTISAITQAFDVPFEVVFEAEEKAS